MQFPVKPAPALSAGLPVRSVRIRDYNLHTQMVNRVNELERAAHLVLFGDTGDTPIVEARMYLQRVHFRQQWPQTKTHLYNLSFASLIASFLRF